MAKIPFDQKQDLSKKYHLSIENVQTIFNHPQTINLFEDIIDDKRDPKQVFKWMYNIIYGNISKKELEFG